VCGSLDVRYSDGGGSPHIWPLWIIRRFHHPTGIRSLVAFNSYPDVWCVAAAPHRPSTSGTPTAGGHRASMTAGAGEGNEARSPKPRKTMDAEEQRFIEELRRWDDDDDDDEEEEG
jgi:hypothetical protein